MSIDFAKLLEDLDSFQKAIEKERSLPLVDRYRIEAGRGTPISRRTFLKYEALPLMKLPDSVYDSVDVRTILKGMKSVADDTGCLVLTDAIVDATGGKEDQTIDLIIAVLREGTVDDLRIVFSWLLEKMHIKLITGDWAMQNKKTKRF